jgi:hypothetical protein
MPALPLHGQVKQQASSKKPPVMVMGRGPADVFLTIFILLSFGGESKVPQAMPSAPRGESEYAFQEQWASSSKGPTPLRGYTAAVLHFVPYTLVLHFVFVSYRQSLYIPTLLCCYDGCFWKTITWW